MTSHDGNDGNLTFSSFLGLKKLVWRSFDIDGILRLWSTSGDTPGTVERNSGPLEGGAGCG